MNNLIQLISKLPTDTYRYLRPTFAFLNARTAMKAYLQALDLASDDEIIMPSYVGWSKNEGSGVYDPIVEIGISCCFYKINRNLTIDLDSLKATFKSEHARVLLLIHYFGFPDPHLKEIAQLAHTRGLVIIEDEAHALYSDYWGGISGRFGDAALLSLHKMLPLPYGGLLVLNQPSDEIVARISQSTLRKQLPSILWDFDLAAIAMKRRENAQWLMEKLRPLEPEISMLFPFLPEGVSPQTLPILINRGVRDNLYLQMNDQGCGVVSLYHTLIEQIASQDFPDSYWLSKHILNLPVHQDVSRALLTSMVESLQKLLGL